MIIRTKQPKDFLEQAKQFRDVMGQTSGCLTAELLELQRLLIVEESMGFNEAAVDDLLRNPRAREAALKELADLVYVAFQAAAAFGWDLNIALDRVHKSNLSKLVDGKPLRREDGKVLKGPNYKPPTLIDLV